MGETKTELRGRKHCQAGGSGAPAMARLRENPEGGEGDRAALARTQVSEHGAP